MNYFGFIYNNKKKIGLYVLLLYFFFWFNILDYKFVKFEVFKVR